MASPPSDFMTTHVQDDGQLFAPVRPPNDAARKSEDMSLDYDTAPGGKNLSPSPVSEPMQSEPEPEIPQLSTQRAVWLTLTCTLSMIVNIASISSASIALPRTGVVLNIQEDKLQWPISAYSLSSGCLLILFGRLADLHGRRRVFVAGSLFLGAFALGSGFAQNEITLDILRGFQGVGAAASIPASLGILAHAFPPSRARSAAFATFSAGAPLGASIGLCLGGALTQVTRPTWRTPYFICAALSLLCVVGAFAVVPADKRSTELDRRVDWPGAFLVTAGLVLIVFVLSDGEVAPQQWRTGYIIALLIIGVLFVVLFVVWQRFLERAEQDKTRGQVWWTPPPLMKLSLWTRGNGRFAVMVCIVFCLMGGFQAWWYWTLLYYQEYRGLSPVLTMVRMLPMIVTGLVCNAIIALTVGFIDVVVLITAGCSLTAVAALLFALINPSTTYWAFGFPAPIVAVFGADFVFAAGTLFIAKIALPHEQSLAGALFQTMNQLGTTFALSISTIVFDRVRAQRSAALGVIVNSTGSNAPQAAQLGAYKAAQWTAFALCVFAALLAIVFLRGVGIVGHPSPTPEELENEKQVEKGDVEVERRHSVTV